MIQTRLLLPTIFMVVAILAAGSSFAPAAVPPSGSGTATAETTDTPASPAQTSERANSALEDLNLDGLLTGNGWQQWGIFVGALLLGWLLGRLAAAVLGTISERTGRRGWDVWSHTAGDATGPVKLVLISLGLGIGFAFLQETSPPLRGFVAQTVHLLYAVAAFWYAFNLVGLVELMLRRFTSKTDSRLDNQVVPLIRKTLRVFLVTIGALYALDSVFNQDIGAWLAGLGIAGLAISLAAQDSLKNLFGSITIIFDRPFQVGERIIYGGYDGIVEEIGFRSTKVRTLTGNLVTIPNANIVNDPIENVGRRPSIRRILNVTITYDTPKEKIEQGVQILRNILEEEDIREPIHQVIDGEEMPPRVYFNDYNSQSLNLFVIYWFVPPAWWDYLKHAERVNLRIFEEFERAGIEFAFPTQTLYLAGDPKRELALKMLGEQQ